MSNSAQRSFAAGEIAPALHARADLARYAIGLTTCRNMVVMRAGGATKRPGTQFVDSAGTSSAYVLTLTPSVSVVASQTTEISAELTDWLGNPIVGTFSCAFATDNAGIATVAATGPRTANVHGVADGAVAVRATIVALGLTSNDCAVTVSDFYVLHAFAGDGTLVVTTGGTGVSMLIIGGGGSGGSVDGSGVGGGGGGAGELFALTAQTLAVTSYPVTVGGGGVAPHADHTIGGGVFGALIGSNGSDTTFFGKTAKGGGGGGAADATLLRGGRDGGSGGGGASAGDSAGAGGVKTAVAPGVGSNGGAGVHDGDSVGAGGGGAGGAGGSAGLAGAGLSNSITGSAILYAIGGGAARTHGTNGGANTGSGGNGGGPGLNCDGGNGGAGVVYVRYLASSGIDATGGIKTTYAS